MAMKGWVNEMWYISIQWRIIQPLRRNEILVCVKTGLNLKNAMLREPVTEVHVLYDSIYTKYLAQICL